MPRIPDTLDPIVSDRLAAGEIISALRIARCCLANPDYFDGIPRTPMVFFRAWTMAREAIRDAVDDCADVNRSNDHACAVVEALGLAGVPELVNAIEHHRRTRPAAPFASDLVDRVDHQLEGAIARLTAALAEPAFASK